MAGALRFELITEEVCRQSDQVRLPKTTDEDLRFPLNACDAEAAGQPAICSLDCRLVMAGSYQPPPASAQCLGSGGRLVRQQVPSCSGTSSLPDTGRAKQSGYVTTSHSRLMHRCFQRASPAVGAGVSPCSTVVPEMVRRAPVAWVISTLRGWLRGDAGMVTCRTPSV
jgi:hypothetical protein